MRTTMTIACTFLMANYSVAQTSTTSDTKTTLLESVTTAKEQRFELSGAEQFRLTKAAVKFAREAGGDTNDAQFVLLAQGALSAGIQAEAKKLLGRALNTDKLEVLGFGSVVADSEQSAPMTMSILDDPTGARNARTLLELAAKQPEVQIIGGQDDKDTRVIGGVVDGTGSDIPNDYFQDCVAVGSDFTWCCTGVLVAPNVVLTAGHCYENCATRVFIGESIFRQGKVYQVIDKVRHPGFVDDPEYLNDLAVLILSEDVPADVAKPKSLATPEVVRMATAGQVVGFGANEPTGRTGYGIRRKVVVAVVSSECDPATTASTRFGCHPKIEMVAGVLHSGKDTCRGDSGGPLFVLDQNEWKLAATTSRATKSSQKVCGDGGNYVLTQPFLEWIRSAPGGHWN